MHCHAAYGLHIESEIEFPELRVLNDAGGEPDVIITSDAIPPVPDSVSQVGQIRTQAEPQRYKLSHEMLGTFLVKDGSRISFDVSSRDVIKKKIFRRTIVEILLAFVLTQRGFLVLHASAVSIDGNAVVFVGDSGVGKSTTAAAFLNEGYQVLDDDVVCIRLDDDPPTVVPGSPQLRLAPEAADSLSITDTREPPGDAGPKKVYHQFDQDVREVTLKNVYVLQESDSLGLKSISEKNKLFVILTSTYIQELLPKTDLTVKNFHQCSKTIENIAIQRLHRPLRYNVLPDLVDLVVRNLD